MNESIIFTDPDTKQVLTGKLAYLRELQILTLNFESQKLSLREKYKTVAYYQLVDREAKKQGRLFDLGKELESLKSQLSTLQNSAERFITDEEVKEYNQLTKDLNNQIKALSRKISKL